MFYYKIFIYHQWLAFDSIWFIVITNSKCKNRLIKTFKTRLTCIQILNIQDDLHSKQTRLIKIREGKHWKQKISKQTYTKVVKMTKVVTSLAPMIINQSVYQTLLLHSFRGLKNTSKSIIPYVRQYSIHAYIRGA